ncbi:GNAT family N-acetyltransferase [Clostridium algidicarnis]|uniref:GNAT family N-acetyltransferase n=1 Tax=Clostridium algidicarnis TaxID=37659 RepID=UPI001C0E7E2F|nr:GNAT family protein [Clostridium algidicarnis]MBU3229116.1 GNAT family N-acetyltransferase [Clostridium algidicarnis]MBU3252651.1 GNAT family N-acetyltransferase [Clostridium algidicarnis]
MNDKEMVIIEKVNLKEEYLIKDNIGISLGRFFIIDKSLSNKTCIIRLNFYKEEMECLLIRSLKLMLEFFLKSDDVHKLNIIINEDVNPKPFVDLGFTLEGILQNKTTTNTKIKDEFIFGINSYSYINQISKNIFMLKGKRVILKLLTPEDYKDVLDYNIRNKEHLQRFEHLKDQSFYTKEVQKGILIDSYKQYLNGTSLALGIYNEGSFIGKIQLSNIVQGIFKSAFLGYSIDKEFEGRGFMKESVVKVINYAFRDMELHRIEASTLVDNYRSRAVLKSSGFQEIGLNKDYLYINGQWRDHISFFKINKELY